MTDVMPSGPLDFAPINAVRCALGEAPTYDAGRNALWYCDIVGKTLHRWDLTTSSAWRWTFASEVTSLGVAVSGRLVVALRDVIGLFNPDDHVFTELAEIERDRPETRLNDGKVGPDGAFWVGTMHDTASAERLPIASLYRVDSRGRVEPKVAGLRVSNGLAFTADGRTMFHADTGAPWIDRWDLDPSTGAIANRTRIVTAGRPDGGATDADGCYWSADVGGAWLNRYTADGVLMAACPLPVAAPTMPCFGDIDLHRLFVTSLRAGRPAEVLKEYPLTGITIAARSPVAGAPVHLFQDG